MRLEFFAAVYVGITFNLSLVIPSIIVRRDGCLVDTAFLTMPQILGRYG